MSLDPGLAGDLFSHVRTVTAVILGLSIGKLLGGVASLIEHPRRNQIWWVHIVWVCFSLISVIGYWWWEFHLRDVHVWTFGRYIFLFIYTSCYFLMCSLLFPKDISDYEGWAEYFLSRRRWFFGIVGVTFVLDIGDTLLKGTEYLGTLGGPYAVRTVAAVLVCSVGIASNSRKLQAFLALTAVSLQLLFFFGIYDTLV